MLDNLLLIRNSQTKMDWVAQRQKVLSQNVANVDTPDYRAQDIRQLRWSGQLPWNPFSFRLAKTQSDHVAAFSERKGPFRDLKSTVNVERTISDNNVVLENELSKMGRSQLEYRLTTNLFRKYSNMYDISLGGNRNS